jgi:hypothetical protein
VPRPLDYQPPRKPSYETKQVVVAAFVVATMLLLLMSFLAALFL